MKPTRHTFTPPRNCDVRWAQKLDSLRVFRKRFRNSDHFPWLSRKDAPYLFVPPLHSTGVRDIGTCERLFYFRDRVGLQLKGTYSPALSIGQAFHKCLELAARGHPAHVRREQLVTDTRSWLSKTCQPLLNGLGLMPDGTPWDKFSNRVMDDLYKAIAMAEILWEMEPLDPERWEVIGSEVGVLARALIGSKKVNLAGRLDLVLRDRSTGFLWVADYKTTSSATTDVAGALNFDIQPHLYRLLTMAEYPEERVAGCIHFVLKKCLLRHSPFGEDSITDRTKLPDAIKTKLDSGKPLTDLQQEALTKLDAQIEHDRIYRGDTFSKYLDRVRAWYASAQKAFELSTSDAPVAPPVLVSNLRYGRTGLPSDIQQVLRKASHLCKRAPHIDNFPRCCNMYRCHGLGGIPACPYLPLCRFDHQRETRWPDLLSDRYHQSHRDMEEDQNEN